MRSIALELLLQITSLHSSEHLLIPEINILGGLCNLMKYPAGDEITEINCNVLNRCKRHITIIDNSTNVSSDVRI